MRKSHFLLICMGISLLCLAVALSSCMNPAEQAAYDAAKTPVTAGQLGGEVVMSVDSIGYIDNCHLYKITDATGSGAEYRYFTTCH